MDAQEIIKITIGDLIFQNAVLQAKVKELEEKLAQANDQGGNGPGRDRDRRSAPRSGALSDGPRLEPSEGKLARG